MLKSARLLRIGLVLSLVAAIRLLMPAYKAVPGQDEQLWFEIYNYSVLLWLAALIVLAFALIVRLGELASQWMHRS